MRQVNNNNNNGGIGVLGALGVLFVALKLTNYIDWSWWLVTMPFWVAIPIIFLVIIFYLLFSPKR